MFGPRVSPTELREQHPESKRKSDFQNHFWAYLVVRRLAFYVSPIFIRLGLSANQVTILGGVVLFVGIFFMSITTNYGLIISGVVLINIWVLFDFVDGIVARFNNTSDPFGAFVDWLIGLVFQTGPPFAVAIVLYRTTSFEILGPIIEIPAVVWFAFAGATVIAHLFRRMISQKADLLLENNSAKLNSGVSAKMVAHSIISFKAPFLFVATLFGFLDIWLLFYTIYNILLIAPTIILQIHRFNAHG